MITYCKVIRALG